MCGARLKRAFPPNTDLNKMKQMQEWVYSYQWNDMYENILLQNLSATKKWPYYRYIAMNSIECIIIDNNNSSNNHLKVNSTIILQHNLFVFIFLFFSSWQEDHHK